ncbi:MAG TPA: DUF4112 domain-containing protein [Longimicrobiales bacterium]|nr:DUF4112 domain-containing protein [Longimicrobiales bacterium]
MSEPHVSLQRLRTLGSIMDELVVIRGTRIRIGLDPVLGLIPGVGDFIGASISMYALFVAARLGTPPSVVLRMAGNILVDAVLGSVPFLGDLFDVGWKSNLRNIALLERYAATPARTRRTSQLLVAGVVIVVLGVIVAAAWAGAAAFRRIRGML